MTRADQTIDMVLAENRELKRQLQQLADRVLSLQQALLCSESGFETGEPRARLRAVIESVPFDLFVIGLDGCYVMQNSICRQTWGDLLGKRPEDVAPDGETLKQWRRNNERAFGGEVVESEGSVILDDGEERHFRTIISPIRTADGISGIVGVDVDVTKLKRAEELLGVQRDLAVSLSAVQDEAEALHLCLSCALAVSGMDCGGIYLTDRNGGLSLRCHRGLGVEFIEHTSHYGADSENTKLVMAGRPFYQRFSELAPELMEDPGGESLRAIAALPLLHNGQVVGCINVGSYRHEEVPRRARSALETLAAQFGGAMARIAVEQRLKERDEQFRFLARQVTDVIWTTDLDLRISYVSRSLFSQRGYPPDEVIGQPIETILPPSSAAAARELVSRLQLGRQQPDPMIIEADARRKDGSWLPVETTASFLADDGGKVIGLVGVTRDISERRRNERERAEIEEQLRHSQKMEAMGTLAGGVAHDFNNLLQGILGYAHMLKARVGDEQFTTRAAGVIEQAAGRAAELTQQLLGFARKGKLQAAPVDMHRIVDNVIAILVRTVGPSIDLKTRYDASTPTVVGDSSQLEQVVMNLAVNARDALPDGGEISFSTYTKYVDAGRVHPESIAGDYLVLAVTDNGCGMSPGVRARIFEPFYTTKPTGKGSGMGLSMLYGIVRSHGGWVEVDSELGAGSEFRVFLRCSEERALITERAPDDEEIGMGRILVVDDEESVRVVLGDMLDALGYQVETVRNGREAVERYRRKTGDVDVVLLDMTMPLMDGRECFRQLKAIDPEVRVVLSTGHAVEGVAQDLLEDGLRGCIRKPYTCDQLQRAIAKAMRDK